MTDEEIQSYREQVFDQSSTQSTTQNNVSDTATQAETVDTTTTENTAADNTQTDATQAETSSNEEVIDANEYLKSNLGFDDWETAKAEITQLRQLKDAPAKEPEFANEESKKAFELITKGEWKAVKAIYDLQEKLEAVDSLSPADAIKLHIEQTNKHFGKADVQDVFEEKYTYPDKPNEDDLDYDDKIIKYNLAVEKIDRRIQRDAITAKEDLAKLKTEIKFPEIPKAVNPELEAYNAYQQNIEQAKEDNQKLLESLSKVSDNDISFQLPFNDEANKMKFDVNFSGEKEGVVKAKEAVANYMDFLSKTYYKEDGSPLVNELTNDIYLLQNKQKVFTEIAKQAVNETKAWFLRNQKNIGDGAQRNFHVVQPTDIDRLREQVFGKTG